jgi:hypothetical protein
MHALGATRGLCGVGAVTARDNWATAPRKTGRGRFPCRGYAMSFKCKRPAVQVVGFRVPCAPTVASHAGAEIATASLETEREQVATRRAQCRGYPTWPRLPAAGCTGALGDGQLFSGLTPVVAIGLIEATQLAVGFTFSCALKRDASVMCWGSNIYGEVGNNSEQSALVPTQVLGLPPVMRISASTFQVCAQTKDGRIFCWGSNEFGSLGLGSRTKAVRTPVQMRGVPCGATLMPGACCAVTIDGSAYCWGVRSGDGSNARHEEGAALVPIEHVVSVVGIRSFFAVTEDDKVWAWGDNETGQLGDGTRETRLAPVQIAIPR